MEYLITGIIIGIVVTSFCFCLFIDGHRERWYSRGKSQANWEHEFASRNIVRDLVPRIPKDKNGVKVIPGEPGWIIGVPNTKGEYDYLFTSEDIKWSETSGWVISWGGEDNGSQPFEECIALETT